MPDKSLSSIGNFPTTAEAHAARLLLGSHGIAAVVVDEMLVGNFWQLGGAVGGAKLQVDAEDATRARELLANQTAALDDQGDAPQSAAWICSQCEERVPGNFDVCWACGRIRSSEDADEQPRSDEPAAPRTAASPADPSPDAIEPETACPRCGAAPLAADGLCRACGTATAPNPYQAPLQATQPESRPARGVLREQRQAADALAERAWKAAMFGCAFVPLNFYSIALLIILAERHERISPRWLRRIGFAWVLNLGVLAVFGVVLFSLIRAALRR